MTREFAGTSAWPAPRKEVSIGGLPQRRTCSFLPGSMASVDPTADAESRNSFNSSSSMNSRGRDPLAAWLTGLAVLNYFMTGFSSLANAILHEQVQGTLESVLMTPISVPTVIVASSAWDFVQATFFSFLYLFFGWLFFDVHYRGSFLLALVFLLLTTVVLSCLGILSASFAMVFKRGDPFGVFLGAGSALFSGRFFPTP